MESHSPISWKNEKLYLLDQRLLPHEEVFLELTTISETINAIKDMVVRGAPCIGFTSIYGMALWVKTQSKLSLESCRRACDEMIAARPTAVNLSYEVNRCFESMKFYVESGRTSSSLYEHLIELGHTQIKLSHEKNLEMAKTGIAQLIKTIGDREWNLMTHCNTGFLACGSLGTALGVISYANDLKKVKHVFVDETRPYMQGTRLTAYELTKEKIPFSIVVEGSASFLLSSNKVDAIFVGADRIAANGDTANKIGTSTLAIVAKYYQVPFYVVAPVSSFDTKIPDGSHIEIEMRPENEITEFKNMEIAPKGSRAINPSFDVTHHSLIKGIICERGFIDPTIPGDLLRVVNL
jgi:methylthioribose-1-phosphate isomerase